MSSMNLHGPQTGFWMNAASFFSAVMVALSPIATEAAEANKAEKDQAAKADAVKAKAIEDFKKTHTVFQNHHVMVMCHEEKEDRTVHIDSNNGSWSLRIQPYMGGVGPFEPFIWNQGSTSGTRSEVTNPPEAARWFSPEARTNFLKASRKLLDTVCP